MTTDERIEKLLNRFGQTLADLPKRYSATSQASARKEAAKFDLQTRRVVSISPESSYICHLADVIEKLVTALEKAQHEIKVVHCADCKHRPEFKSFTDEYGHTFTNYISPDSLCPLVCDDDWYSVVRDDDWFCGDGEPMEEQNEQKEE